MFIPDQMRKVNIFLDEQDVEPVVVALARLGVLDLSENEQQTWGSTEQSHWNDLTDTYTAQAQRLENLLNSLDISCQEEKHLPDNLAPHNDAAHIRETLNVVEQALHEWQAQTASIEEQLNCVHLLKQSMHLLDPLAISIEDIRDLHFLYLVIGKLPREAFDNLQHVLFRIPFVIVPIEIDDRDSDDLLVFAATDQANALILDRTMRSIFMEPLELPDDLTGTPSQVMVTLQQQQAEAEQRRAELAQEREHLAQQWGNTLLALWQQAGSNAVVTRAISSLGYREGVYLITGWVPEQSLDSVVTSARETTEQRASIEVLEPQPGRKPSAPTRLRNPPFLRPFETIVSTFGLPSYDELDPTPLVALTFVTMFGMMFGDVGHGLLLALAALGLWWWANMPVVGNVLLASGASAAIFGLLYGSLFGNEEILPHLWLSPLGSILDILIAAIIAGVVFLNIGFLLHLVSAARSQRWGKFLFSRSGLAGIWLYWSLLGGVLVVWQGYAMPLLLWVGLVLVPATLLFFNEPLINLVTGRRPLLEAKAGEYSILAFFELFETLISYISNSFSFIRLGAFAVAHAGLTQVIFLFADMSGAWYWPIVVVGTVIIVGFEGLIISIQTLRLEYYEFFGKFFQGQGRAFVPLRLLDKAERA